MLCRIQEDVGDGSPHLKGRGQIASVVTLAEEGAPSAELAVDQAGDVRQETLQTSRQRPRGRSLTHEMDVVRLNREVDDPKRPAAAG
jgi:hypothetical protein